MKWLLPPTLWILTILAMVAIMLMSPPMAFYPAWLRWLGIAIFPAGLALNIMAARQFHIAKTNIKTFNDPKVLVTTGLFARSRNPMYLGFCISLLGAALLTNNVKNTVIVFLFFATCHFWYVPFEEAAAEKQFGDAYLDYKKRVRRWI
ncbi:MAG: isoprenylcysteine carboxylmethyltransferase family protein [Pseudomonadota bacterium]